MDTKTLDLSQGATRASRLAQGSELIEPVEKQGVLLVRIERAAVGRGLQKAKRDKRNVNETLNELKLRASLML
jgi:hypothetical protein